MRDRSIDRTQTEGEGRTEGAAEGFLSPGQLLGERYEVRRLLGAGGMGEVWQAFDLKLQVEVALKALRADVFADERRIEGLRREVRAAREVVSPNVCRIFDLEEVADYELVSMEYVDGSTLLEVLRERSPLELKEAQDIASQLLAGLEAIHTAGLVHRDIKPENIMLTRTGRVVVMDFGIARGQEEGAGTVSGTPAYMSPEQARGGAVDARSDLYAVGVVLAEIVSPEGMKDRDSRESLWEGMKQDPPRIADTPWSPVLRRAVAHDPERRYDSARTLTRALEEITLRVEGADDLNPYPGLASFAEEDAEYFFGREAEVEQMWRRLEGPARILALVGPSGAGKTSFLRAGLIPSAGAGWGIVRCTPGDAGLASLRRAVIPELAGDVEALEQLAAGDEAATVQAFARWRKRHDRALVIVDQIEELFTQNSEDEQRRVASVLSRLVLEADTHVLLGMRDDFLSYCAAHESLRPIFESMTPLQAPVGPALRRAVVQPAATCGYRFSDDDLVDEMLAEVEGERGALPLLAFAMARLWERRDRQEGLLTREAYGQEGGVEGALAQHAEGTLEEIGANRLPIVRELFRNLVTAERTRAVRGWDELLSVFDEAQQSSAEEVLRALIDARLLTSYEVDDEDGTSHRRVEIVHESLLANWPRLVRWQTQDADAAQLRDQLRQAAKTWDDHGRSLDLLWTGAVYREFASWQERYSGGLSDLEEAFAAEMTTYSGRRRRRRRFAVGGVFAVLLTVLAVVGVARQQAIAEANRAEAAKVLALGLNRLDRDPSEALAFATASLELSDSRDARVFVMRALWAGPIARVLSWDHVLPGSRFPIPVFSPDGRWLAAEGFRHEYVAVFPQGGGRPIVLGGHAVSSNGTIDAIWTRSGLLVTGHRIEGRVRVWAMPGGRLVREIKLFDADQRSDLCFIQVAGMDLVSAVPESTSGGDRRWRLRSWTLPDGEARDLGVVNRFGVLDHHQGSWVFADGEDVVARPLPFRPSLPGRVIARHSDRTIVRSWRRPSGLYSADRAGGMTIWTTAAGTGAPGRRLSKPDQVDSWLIPEPGGRWALSPGGNYLGTKGRRLLWNLQGVTWAGPIELRRSGRWFFSNWDVHPNGAWAVEATNGSSEITFWSLEGRRPLVVDAYDTFHRHPVGFSLDERYVVTNWGQDRIRFWPLPESGVSAVVDLLRPKGVLSDYTIDPTGRYVLSAGYAGSIYLLSMDGEDPIELRGFHTNDLTMGGAFSPSGRLVALATDFSEIQPSLRIWGLNGDEVAVYDMPPAKRPRDLAGSEPGLANHVAFMDETTLYTSGSNGLLRWDLDTGTYRQVLEPPEGGEVYFTESADRRFMLTFETSRAQERSDVTLHDLESGSARLVEIPGDLPAVHLGPEGMIYASGDRDGRIWVGRIDGGEPHVLAGHDGPIEAIAISPDRRWLASSGEDQTFRLWPMPDLSKPPLHTLPHDELLARLHSLTNLRAVRDEESSTGWKIEVGPFPGWETVPEW